MREIIRQTGTFYKGWERPEEGSWRLLLVIDTENLRKIKLAKKDGNLLLMNVRISLFHHPSSMPIKQIFLFLRNIFLFCTVK